jgi:tripartite-type tricarboxylate transporter receptor subunit TctC
MQRRNFLQLAAATSVMPSTITLAQGDTYPNRPVRVVVGFAPGGGVDLTARPFAQRLSVALGQPIVVENKPGVNGNIAASYVANSVPADGYTLLQINGAMATNSPFLYNTGVPDYLRDLVPVTGITESPQAVIVPASLGVKTLSEFVALAKSGRTSLNFASGGNGTLAHLAFELFRRDEGLKIEHIPYRGTGPAVLDMVAGRIHLLIDGFTQVKGQVDAGVLRVLAVTGPTRLAAIPQVPTSGEAGFPRLQAIGWQALMAPAKVPAGILKRLRDAGQQVMQQQEFIDFLEGRGSVGRWRSASEVNERIRLESAVWGEVIRSANIKLD